LSETNSQERQDDIEGVQSQGRSFGPSGPCEGGQSYCAIAEAAR
jgi:hypothetical protein